MIKKIFKYIFLFVMIIPLNVLAYSDYIIPGGDNIGIKLNANGVVVVGFYKVNNKYISNDIKIGDLIVKINNNRINSINDLGHYIKNTNGNLNIDIMRNNRLINLNLKLEQENGKYKTGLFVKDSISGIGTLTYIDPNTKLFGALGHEILDNSGKIFNSKKGNIFSSSVTKIKPSNRGIPGEKNALINNNKIYGSIFENTNKGIFGNYNYNFDNRKLYKVAQPNEIKKGKAYMLTVLDGDNISKYEINIIKINSNDTKNILFEVTDKELLNKTNGIIQGMSGSPIIQDDKIIGAVTHVIVDDPHKGYGIFITNMLKESEN